MAKILFTSIVADMRGKLNGSVFARNRGGNYVRTKTSPLNPSTSWQQTARARLAQFSAGWRNLSDAQRASWNEAVDFFKKTNVFGNEITPTGKNLYTRLNINLLQAEQSAIDEAPVPEDVQEPTSMAVEWDSGTSALTVTFAPDPVPTGTAFLVFATDGVPVGREFVKNRYRLIGVLAAATASGEDITTMYTDRFDAIPAAGLNLFVKLVPVNTNTGQKGTGRSASVVID